MRSDLSGRIAEEESVRCAMILAIVGKRLTSTCASVEAHPPATDRQSSPAADNLVVRRSQSWAAYDKSRWVRPSQMQGSTKG